MTIKLFVLETLTIVIGVVIAELLLDAGKQIRLRGRMLDGTGA